MKKISIIILLGSLISISSCSYQNTNSIDQDDVNKGDTEIYGVHPDSSAAQLKNKYTANPENEKRAAAIKEKLYGKASVDSVGV
jgi:hypothetical protein